MENQELIKQVTEKAEKWLTPAYDAETQAEVKRMLANEDKTELIEAFYKDLEFGTGGLRGIMGVGTNRMNIYTVGAATQGLSNYLNANFKDIPQISVVVGYDCRNNSDLFAKISADIFAANGIKVYLFEDMRPTPEMSFAIRHLGCQSGIILTASHNPKEYNGYKLYDDKGCQLIPCLASKVIERVNAIEDELAIDANCTEEQKKICEINAGMYCFKNRDLFDNLDKLTTNNAQNEYYLTDLVKILANQGKVVKGLVVEDRDEVMGINDCVELNKAYEWMRNRINNNWLKEGVQIVDPKRTVIGKDVKIGHDVIIHPNVEILGKTEIGDFVEILPGSYLNNSKIENCVVVDSSKIVDSCISEGTIVGPMSYVSNNKIIK